MLFNSYTFLLLYLPATFAGFFLLARVSHSGAIAFLALASLVFYGYWDPGNLLILAPSIAINYLLAIAIVSAGKVGLRKVLLAVGISGNILCLAYFKYRGLLTDSANTLFLDTISVGKVELPLGISFFTFTQIAYLVDVYCGVARDYRFMQYCLFVSYFPHLIAGPILHHKEMIPQFNLVSTFVPDWRRIAVGLSMFAVGLFKKCVLADGLAPFVGPVFDQTMTNGLSIGDAWIGTLAYSLELYYDFSGYCDMAIGISLLFNITLPLNFNSPYKAENIIEFWRRWHMTLSRFLRNYLYIPLGGNRRGALRRHINLMITMALGGLWHGAGWTFCLWGVLHGIYLIVNHAWLAIPKNRSMLQAMQFVLDRGGAWTLTMLAVIIAWVPFRAVSLEKSALILSSMAGFGAGPSRFENWLVPAAAVSALAASAMLLPNTQEIFSHQLCNFGIEGPVRGGAIVWQPTRAWAILIGATLAVGFVMVSATGEFLYFQF